MESAENRGSRSSARKRKKPHQAEKIGSPVTLGERHELNSVSNGRKHLHKEIVGDYRKIKSDINESGKESVTEGINDRKIDEQESGNRLLKEDESLRISIEVDIVSVLLLFSATITRFYRLVEPRNIVFDELHYGKYVGLYMRNTFFFDSHPPFGKQLVAIAAYLAGFDGTFKFDKIGTAYTPDVPLFALRLIPAVCGTLLVPVAYHIMRELGCKRWTSFLVSLMLICENALLTQSRFILMEPILLFFALSALYCVLRYQKAKISSAAKWFWLILTTVLSTLSLCVKYAGWYSWCLTNYFIWKDFWKNVVGDLTLSNKVVFISAIFQFVICTSVSVLLYLTVFYIHLSILYKAGPHDSVMTSAFQASLEGGLASITKGQPLQIAHGSQITLRHSHGRTCWLHSHAHVYPLRYSDKRGSSHQQQVTCYTFKDVNNWWIVKRPEKNNLVVGEPIDVIHHGDVVQLVHGITSRALNSHDVAAPVSPHNQEVSCYIDYNVSMPAQNLWRVDIVNREQVGDVWHTIQSLVRLIHVNSSQALKFSGRQLPDWGFYQYEIVTDKIIQQEDTVWNVEEHRYTKSDDEKEREREMVNAEMIPLKATHLSFWEKFLELQYKMLFSSHQEDVQNHMYSSDPLEWPFLTRGIAYWVSPEHNGQVHLLGNIVLWYSGSFGVVVYTVFLTFYVLRRRRHCFDLEEKHWRWFVLNGDVLLAGYLLHYVPYFFVDRTLFLHQYLPALLFKILLMATVIEHISYLLRKWTILQLLYQTLVVAWLYCILYVFKTFSVVSYGVTPLSAEDVMKLKWKETWDFIIHKP